MQQQAGGQLPPIGGWCGGESVEAAVAVLVGPFGEQAEVGEEGEGGCGWGGVCPADEGCGCVPLPGCALLLLLQGRHRCGP